MNSRKSSTNLMVEGKMQNINMFQALKCEVLPNCCELYGIFPSILLNIARLDLENRGS